MTWPSWSEIALGAGGLLAFWRWMIERRDRRSDKAVSDQSTIESLEKRLAEAELEVKATQATMQTAMKEKDREIDLIREDRLLVMRDRDQWMDRAEHLEKIIYGSGSDRS